MPGQVHLVLEQLHAGVLSLCHQTEKTMKKKYVDDLTLLESIDLKPTLELSPPIIGPPNLHELPGLSFPVNNTSYVTF